jgi:arabinogalactan oligomer/maltooligosaccharide transport system substrate-binding protein
MKINRMRGLLVAAATAGVLATGVAPIAHAASLKTITVWADDQRGPQLLALLGGNTTIAKGYKVKVKFFSNLTALQSAWGKASAATAPDIITGPASFTLDAKSGKLAPIVYTAAMKKAFPAGGIDAMSYKGRAYGVPLDIDTTAMIWNKKFGAAPTTFQGLIDYYNNNKVSKSLTGGICAAEGTWGSQPILTALGGGAWVLNKNGSADFKKTLINSATFKTNIQKLLGNDGKSNGFFQWDGCLDAFKAGTIPAVNTGAWNLDGIKNANIDYTIQSVPGGHQWANYSGAWLTSFAAKHGVALGAKQILTNFFGSSQGQSQMSALSSRPPASLAALKSTILSSDTRAFVKAASSGMPQYSAYLDDKTSGNNWYDTLGAVYNDIFVDGKAVNATLDAAAPLLLQNWAHAATN